MSKYQENVGPSDGLNVKNAALLLIDHQVGLMQLVRDMNPEEFKNNVVGLAKSAKNFGLPVSSPQALTGDQTAQFFRK